MFAAEANGLAWLAETRALRIPAVLAHGGGSDGVPPFLVLEFLERARERAVSRTRAGARRVASLLRRVFRLS